MRRLFSLGFYLYLFHIYLKVWYSEDSQKPDANGDVSKLLLELLFDLHQISTFGFPLEK
jgi:hypothetical protein